MTKNLRVRVKLEPRFQAFSDSKEVITLRGKSLELFQFLVEHRWSRFSREMLAQKFWPRADKSRALLSLRQTLFGIKNKLGDRCPISCTRTSVYCRSSAIYVSRRGDRWSPSFFITARRTAETMPETDQRERILSAFRREPLLRFLPRVQAASEDASLSRESRSLAKFFLAYSYNETNRSPLAIKTAVAMLADAQNLDEQVLAKHALGGILWHAGHFEAGLTHLWEASEIASSDPIAKAHILTNIAIGSYEARHRSDLSYATAMAEQAYQTAPHAEHSIVLDYVKCLELIETGSPEIAVHFLTQTLINVTSASHRLAVYMLEALALAQLRCGHHAEAQQHLSQARVLRQTLHMSPSIVEARRLRALRREIEREEL